MPSCARAGLESARWWQYWVDSNPTLGYYGILVTDKRIPTVFFSNVFNQMYIAWISIRISIRCYFGMKKSVWFLILLMLYFSFSLETVNFYLFQSILFNCSQMTLKVGVLQYGCLCSKGHATVGTRHWGYLIFTMKRNIEAGIGSLTDCSVSIAFGDSVTNSDRTAFHFNGVGIVSDHFSSVLGNTKT